MIELEDFIKNNREELDKQVPKKQTWTSDKVITRSFDCRLLLTIAAILVLVTTFFIFQDSSKNNVFSDVEMQSPEGKMIALDPTLNKYTLVQFWESGNVMCNDQNCYYYLPAYEKYKDKGFEIYAISLDEDPNSWLKGIEENKLPWIHVSDLQGWDSPICVECNISKVPTSFLLNSKGEVIEKDLDAEKLESTLAMLF